MAHPELLIPFISYAIATTFTPGPNNASASSSGMQNGFRKTL
ncbi:MAG: LysE family translocator, partial [Bacteroidales bacterium]|nr:LysE family translocator [Bacteroidales bacterium]